MHQTRSVWSNLWLRLQLLQIFQSHSNRLQQSRADWSEQPAPADHSSSQGEDARKHLVSSTSSSCQESISDKCKLKLTPTIIDHDTNIFFRIAKLLLEKMELLTLLTEKHSLALERRSGAPSSCWRDTSTWRRWWGSAGLRSTGSWRSSRRTFRILSTMLSSITGRTVGWQTRPGRCSETVATTSQRWPRAETVIDMPTQGESSSVDSANIN